MKIDFIHHSFCFHTLCALVLSFNVKRLPLLDNVCVHVCVHAHMHTQSAPSLKKPRTRQANKRKKLQRLLLSQNY